MSVPGPKARLALERHQAWLYLLALALGLGLGQAWPTARVGFERALWPLLALLLFATFVQVPLLHVRAAFADGRFLAAVLLGNFVLAPLLVALLLPLLPPDPALRLGVLLVLLVPCTDWFLPFNQLGGGDPARAIAVTPLNLLLQLLLLPLWLGWLGGPGLGAALAPASAWPALLLVLLPLLAAAAAERWLEARPARASWRERLAWWPVPLLALVVLAIAASQAMAARAALPLWPRVVPVYLLWLLLAALLARALTRLLRLPAVQGRTLAFSFGTRNSFVVLPFTLALPAGWETAALAIVLQALVELLGMMVFVWWVPRHLFPRGVR
ncbi:bile acid:sodium symporter [Thermomonas flagellata]|uniref:bile acid:sodium symporter n=1 Tax=Thermomonas flagellata TaxID=2888524 RepID=UPI001F03C3F2|nr:arsenic resistance protein [Thermomonas flagellata]